MEDFGSRHTPMSAPEAPSSETCINHVLNRQCHDPGRPGSGPERVRRSVMYMEEYKSANYGVSPM